MSGLLMKDLRIMLVQGNYLLMVFGIFVIMMISGNSSAFLIGYVTLFMMFFSISTIAYDEADNGYAFLFTLPVSRQDYVRAKYVFGLLTSAAFWLIACLMTFVYRAAITKQLLEIDHMTPAAYLMVSSALLLVSWVVLAVFLPIDLKYGVEKGRIVLLVICGGFAGGMFVLSKSAVFRSVDFTSLENIWSAVGLWPVILAVVAVTAVIIVVSMQISTGIMKRKEF